MSTVKFRQLIDMAIGSPDPGHVNFNALHCILSCFAEKLNILDETVDYSKYETINLCNSSTKDLYVDLNKCPGCGIRIGGGFDPDGEENDKPLETENEPGPTSHAADEPGEIQETEIKPQAENVPENEMQSLEVNLSHTNAETEKKEVEQHIPPQDVELATNLASGSRKTIPSPSTSVKSMEDKNAGKTIEIQKANPSPSTSFKSTKGSTEQIMETSKTILSPSTSVKSITGTKAEQNGETSKIIASPSASTKSIEEKLEQHVETTKAIPSPSTSLKSLEAQPDPMQVSVLRIENRVSKVEIWLSKLAELDNFFTGIAIMKDQLELAMQQLLLLTYLTLSKKPDCEKALKLFDMAQILHSICKENTAIKGSNRFELPSEPSLTWRLSELQLEEATSSDDIWEMQTSPQPQHQASTDHLRQFEPEGCLCYSPGKLLDQLMELKTHFCILTNKVNELTAKLVKQEAQQTLSRMQEMQEQMKVLQLSVTNLKEQQERAEIRLTNNILNVENIKRTLEDVLVAKIDKTEVELQLADKVDYNQLQKKVSLDQMLEIQCRLDKRFNEVFRQIKENDKKLDMSVETLQQTLGYGAIEGILNTFRQQIENKIKSLHDMLQKYVDATNDDCAAAGARVKVLQDLACLSCDTNCVMRTMEKSKVGKLRNAHASPSLSPFITYEVGNIRKSGLNAGRHAGGLHTTNTARDRVEKILLNGK
ncbi:uncharacterized protein LOC106082838 [Stomoxys calcitrans]|uniref:uncharacterized protein LOC106082838 n=1 Tax=Stomoxys calcitrans TaxID=35570 RepID=UPI0027E2C8C2|nr:uncharacterized protein LOC106082838 [Stomoxys calcitrans]